MNRIELLSQAYCVLILVVDDRPACLNVALSHPNGLHAAANKGRGFKHRYFSIWHKLFQKERRAGSSDTSSNDGDTWRGMHERCGREGQHESDVTLLHETADAGSFALTRTCRPPPPQPQHPRPRSPSRSR